MTLIVGADALVSGIEVKQTGCTFLVKNFFADISYIPRVRSNKTSEAFSKFLSIEKITHFTFLLQLFHFFLNLYLKSP